VLFQRTRNRADIELVTVALQQYAKPLHRYLPAHTPLPCYLSILYRASISTSSPT
jgi:hypothetical protein